MKDPGILAQAASGIPPASFAWINAIQAGDVWRAWTGMDDEFRLTLTQMVVDGSGLDRRQFVDALRARDELTDEWSEVMAEPVLDVLESMVSLLNGREVGGASRPRMIGPDLELFPLVPLDELPKDENGVAFLPPGGSAASVGVVLRLVDGREWLVAGAMHAMPRPGDRPVFEAMNE